MDLDPQLAAAHAEIPYASSAVVTLAYREEDLAHPLDGYGYVVPRVEGSDVLACTWTSSKWEGRAPAGGVLVRVYAGRFGGRDVTEDSTESLVALARDEVRDVGIEAGRASPAFTAGRSGCRSTFSATRTGWTGSTRPRRSPRSRTCRGGVSGRGHSRLHPLRRGGRALGRAVARWSPRMTRETSEQFFSEARELMPGGVSSPVQAFQAVGGSPVFVERGEGAYLVDVDGNRYVDYVLSWGALVLGHAHPRVVAALEERVRRGTSYGAPSPLEVELARLIREAMPSIEASCASSTPAPRRR